MSVAAPVRIEPSTFAGLLRARAAEHPERLAFTFLGDGQGEERLTYGELHRRARAIASLLAETAAPGERALLLYPPGLDFIAAFFGCLYAGVIAVPAYPPRQNDRSQSRLRAIGRDARPVAALTTAALLAATAGGRLLAERAPELAGVRFLSTDGLAGSGPALPEPAADAVAFLQYTSGSTATPKGVRVTHANLLDNERAIAQAFGMDESSVVVGWLPLYHDMGLIGNVLQPLYSGAQCVLMSPVAFLQQPRRWLETVSRFRGTVSGGPNFAYDLTARKVTGADLAGLDLSSWEVAFNGAEPVRAETLDRFARSFAPCGFQSRAFYPCYGLAEATLFVSGGTRGTEPRSLAVAATALENHEIVPAEEGEAARRLVSSGRTWGLAARVVDAETGLAVPEGRVGEIWLAGESVADGYWQNEEATERDFRAHLASGEGPFLRTGDLGCLLGGELYVTGRLKDLIILRGRNHYPQDIERTVEAADRDLRPGCGAAFAVETGGEERLVVVQEVERTRRAGFEELAQEIRQAVAAEHEVAVADVVLIRTGTLAKTSSGKVQRRATRDAYLAGELTVVGRSALPAAGEDGGGADLAEPSLEDLAALGQEERVAALVELLRGRAAAALEVGAAAGRTLPTDQPLTALGLDSLAAIALKGGVEESLGLDLPLPLLLEGASLEELARHLAVELPVPVPLDDREPAGEEPRLSYGQRSLWFLERFAPEGGAYNIAVAASCPELAPAVLGRALATLVARHAALRTVFPLAGEEPRPRELPAGDPAALDFAQEDASGWSEEALRAWLAGEAYRPFDLTAGPLLRVRAFRRAAGFVLLVSVHHVAVDFQSLAVLARELGALLAGRELPPVPVAEGNLARRQAALAGGARGAAFEETWRQRLSGLPDLELPTDRIHPAVQTYRGGWVSLRLTTEETAAARRLSTAAGATLFTTLVATFAAQLGRYSGQDDFAVGAPTSGRTGPGLADTVGYLVNPVALRFDLSGLPSFADHLERTRQRVHEALAGADYPFPLLAERLRPARDAARTPLFQVMFVLQQDRGGDAAGLAAFGLGEEGVRLDLGPLALTSLALPERRSPFDLTLKVAAVEGGELLAGLEYNADLYDAATARRMLSHFETLLAAAVARPELPLSSLSLLPAVERQELLALAGPLALAAHGELGAATLHQAIERHADEKPETPALVWGRETTTYGELEARANRLAHHLRALGVGAETRVGVCLARGAELIVAALAVLKAGGVYVPLDPAYPEERLRLLVDDARVRVLLTRGGVIPSLGGAALTRVDLERDAEAVAARPAVRPDNLALPGNLAYLIYTSGSTGRPKGVAVEHRSPLALAAWARGVWTAEEWGGVLFSTPISFDVSVFEIFLPLVLGGRILGAESLLDLPALPAAGEVRLVCGVPSAVIELLREGGLPTGVSTINLGGEPVPPALVAEITRALPGARILDCYGPSEDTVYSTVGELSPERAVTIGRPVGGTVARLLDRTGALAPKGFPGELCLGGSGLSRGYLDRPRLTAERFLPDPHGEPGTRLYHTGDLARLRPDGTLEYLGRLDHQVKVRGVRIELGEIEAAIHSCPGVLEAAATLFDDGRGGRMLVGYAVPEEGTTLSAGKLRAHLKRSLPDALVPARFVVLGALARTASGKIDRRALPAPERVAGGKGAPRTPAEAALLGIFREVLDLPEIGIHDNFFELGGHSLLAVRVLSRVTRAFGAALPVSSLFLDPTVAGLAGRLAEARREAALLPVAGMGSAPLSFGQLRLWFLDRLEGERGAYAVTAVVRLSGRLAVPALAASLSGIARRHEPLRTVYRLAEDEPVQIALPWSAAAFPLPVVDLGALPEGRIEAAWQAAVAGFERRRFDLAHGPMARFLLVGGLDRTAGREHVLAVSMHHIATDGWSMGVFFRELALLYEAAEAGRPSPLPELPLRYADYAVWQRREVERQTHLLPVWGKRLAGLPVLELPTDRPRPVEPRSVGAGEPVELPGTLVAALRAFALAHGGTLFMALLAGYAALLHRLSGQVDFAVGVPVAGRNRVETEGLIGFFVNTLPVRVSAAGGPSGAELLARVREELLWAQSRSEAPFEKLVEELAAAGTQGHTPLVQALFAFLAERRPPSPPGLDLTLVERAPTSAKFDLTLSFSELAPAGEGRPLPGFLEYRSDLFDRATAARFAAVLMRLLAGMAAGPERRVADLPVLSESERGALLTDWNATSRPLPEGWEGLALHQLFERAVARQPEAPAVLDGTLTLSYGALNARANRLAHHLIALGVGPEVRVAVSLPRRADLLVALLAVQKAGGAYVPLDPAYPEERLRFMLADSGARALVAAGPAAALGDVPRVDLTEGSADAAFLVGRPETDPVSRARPQNLSYVIYTSGSTGTPKGVAVEHRSAIALCAWARETFSAEELAFVLAATSVSFDVSVFEIFVPLALGGCLVLADNVLALGTLPQAGLVRTLAAVPSAVAEVARAGHLPASLITVVLAGEAVPAELTAAIVESAGRPVRVVNAYGPTEDTTYSTFAELKADAPVTIGRPLANSRAYVVDPAFELAVPGTPGELLLGGAGLARGYLGRPELTAARFRPDPFGLPGGRLYRTGDLARHRRDGQLLFLGRTDSQVKVRGFRIELGEVEAALTRLPGVAEAAVVVQGTGGAARLVGYVASASLVGSALRSRLKETLPEPMVPAVILVLDTLPRTPNGKVDRKALPAPEHRGVAAGEPPRGAIEERLAGMVQALLEVPAPSRHDSFFDLGGHSLLAARLLSRVASELGAEIPLSAFFRDPSIAGLGELIAGARGPRGGRAAIAPVPRPAEVPLSFAQQRHWFLWELDPASPQYNIAGGLALSGPLDAAALSRALAALVRRHEVLRTIFPDQGGRPVQRILPVSSPALPRVDLSGLPEEAREVAADLLAEVFARRPFDLTTGPLLRAALVVMAKAEQRLLLSLHHAIADGWSLGVMTRDLSALYRTETAGGPELPELPLQYADFALWQRRTLAGEELERQLAWWRETLAGAPPLDLPTDHPRPPVASGRGALLPVSWDERPVRTLALGAHATPFMVLAAAFAAVLSRYTGQEDLTIGSPVAGRDRRELEPLVGCFVNTLPLRLAPAAGTRFADFVAAAREVTLAAYDHQGVPVEKLAQDLALGRDRSRTPLFSVVLALQNTPSAALDMAGVTARPLDLPTGTAKFDLTLLLSEGWGEVRGGIEYSTDLFERSTIERFAGHFAAVLAAGAVAPETVLADLPLLTAGERQQLLSEWNETAAPFPAESSIADLVAAQVARTPDAEAVVGRSLRLTYRELAARAAGVARGLKVLGVGPEVRVGVCLAREPHLVAGLLGVLAAGGAYVPLDPAYPRERLRYLLGDSQAGIVLTEERLAPLFDGFAGTVLRLEDLAPDPAASAALPRRAVSPRNLAYLIYTSGSTGEPKAVAIEHRSAVAILAWARETYSDEELSGVFAGASIAFDISIIEIFAPLAWGGRTILGANALDLPDHPAAGEVRLFEIVPSVMAELSRHPRLPDSVLTVNLPGEPLKGAVVEQVFARFPRARRAINLYGPSEDTTYSTFAVLPRDYKGEPDIGRPVANARLYVVDHRGLPVPVGIPGEIWLGGVGVSRGYLGRSRLTASRYVPDDLSGRTGGRLYRTGDLARHRPDGRLEYLGRIDTQVKVRGFRVELGEIESALSRHPGVIESAALVRDDLPGGRGLVGYAVFAPGREPEDPAAELKRFLAATLPEHMVPVAFVTLPALPLTGNGKVDRKNLPAPARREDRPAGEGRHRSASEELLGDLFAELLGLPAVGPEDSFFDLGGHSLLLTQLASRVREIFEVELPLATYFEAPTAAELAREIEGARAAGGKARAEPIEPLPRDGRPLALSFAQERLWFLDRLDGGAGATYSVPFAVRITGPLDRAALAAAFAGVVRRHEALRTLFPEADGEPVAVVGKAPAEWPLPLVDLSRLPADARRREEAEIGRREAATPFALAHGPLLRTRLLAAGPREHLLLANVHHIVSDGWSMGVLLREISAGYGASTPGAPGLPALPIQYADFAAWQRRFLAGEELERQLGYWRRQLAGLAPVLPLPTDRPRPPVQTSRGAEVPVRLAPALSQEVFRAARLLGVTPFMLLVAAFTVLLGRSARQEDVAVGTPIAGRTRRETEGLIGFFVNTLVLRTDLSGNPTFAGQLARVRRTALAAFEHQDLPFEKLVDELKPARDMSHQPLVQVLFALQNAPLGPLALPGLELSPVHVESQVAKLDLSLALAEQGGVLAGELEYATDLFDSATAARLGERFLALLDGALAAPETPLALLPVMTPGERQQTLIEWSDAHPWPLEVTLHELFADCARRAPDATATVFGDACLSYGELDRRAGVVARHLARLGVMPDTTVCLSVERNLEMAIGIFGVLKAGGAYVPVDPGYPEERFAYILADSGAPVVLTQARHAARLPSRGARIVRLDADWPEITCGDETWKPPSVAADGLAYVIYTSGSTGRPKGVMMSHRGAVAYIKDNSLRFSRSRGDRQLQFSTISFDASVEEVFGALTHGSTLFLMGEDTPGVSELLALCNRYQIDVMQLPTAYWHELAAAMEGEDLAFPASLRLLITGGERMLPQRLVSWWKRVPRDLRFVNAYGPTETTVACTMCHFPGPVPVNEGMAEVPIGQPLPYVRSYVLDPYGEPVPIGVVGELYVGGRSLARGYRGRPELTASRFVPNPWSPAWAAWGARLYRTGDLVRRLGSGYLEFAGRVDEQVKVRGFRIELGEIEATLTRHPAVTQAVAVVREGASGGKRLVAYAAVATGARPAEAELKGFLASQLPSYMVPEALVMLAELPVNVHGKVDRRALPDPLPPRSSAQYAPPGNALEAEIALLTAELLGVPRVGVHDNFFDLGGTSLLLVKLHSRLQKALGVSFPLVDLFKFPTVASLSRSLAALRPEKPAGDAVRVRTETRRESMRQLQTLRQERRNRRN